MFCKFYENRFLLFIQNLFYIFNIEKSTLTPETGVQKCIYVKSYKG